MPCPEMVMLATPSHPLVHALGKANVNNNAEDLPARVGRKATRFSCEPFIAGLNLLSVAITISAPCQFKARNTYFPTACYSTSTAQKIDSFMGSSVLLWLCRGHTRACNVAPVYIFQASSSKICSSPWVFGCSHQLLVYLCC